MGSLHEHNKSYWVATVPEGDSPAYPVFSGGGTVDVAVVGAGIAGLTTALRLVQEGASVALLEADRVASGVTAYTTAKVTSLHGLTYASVESGFGPEGAAAYAEANQAGLAEVVRLVGEHAIDCTCERLPAFTYTEEPERGGEVEAEVAAAVRAGLAARFTTEVGLPYPVQAAIRVENQLQFHPRRYCLGLAAALVEAGGAIYEQTRVLDVDEDDDGVRVLTAVGELRAGSAVLCTQLPVVDPAALFARTHPARSYALAVRLRDPAPEGMHLSADSPTRSVRPISVGGNTAVIGGEGHKVGHDPDTGARYAALEGWARERFEVEEITHRWSAHDYMPADGVPYIGRLSPGARRLYVATGFGKWGMTTGTAAALIIADAIAGRSNPWAFLFDATRLNPKGSARSVVTETVDVAKRFVGDRLRSLGADPAVDLAPGQGGVRDLDGERVAAYRDDHGRLHAVSARCTHLGCLVAWNVAELSWDCPCHGSRFDVDGGVLCGPATRPLDGVEISARAETRTAEVPAASESTDAPG